MFAFDRCAPSLDIDWMIFVEQTSAIFAFLNFHFWHKFPFQILQSKNKYTPFSF